MLHIDTLQKSFDGNHVLDIQNLNIGPGINFMIGPNGAGKTTFLKCLAGIHPFRGKVLLSTQQGPDTVLDFHKDRVQHRLQVNFSEAEPLFPGYLKGKELLDFYTKVKGPARIEIKAVMRKLNMNYLRQPIRTYSSGMKKKLALLLAFSGSPSLICLDEPFAAVDQPSRKVITAVIRERVESGVHFLISSHQRDLHQAFGAGTAWLLENRTFRKVEGEAAEIWLETTPATDETANSRS